jgi:hypothetical protein
MVQARTASIMQRRSSRTLEASYELSELSGCQSSRLDAQETGSAPPATRERRPAAR